MAQIVHIFITRGLVVCHFVIFLLYRVWQKSGHSVENSFSLGMKYLLFHTLHCIEYPVDTVQRVQCSEGKLINRPNNKYNSTTFII